jgi:hypothetical protein
MTALANFDRLLGRFCKLGGDKGSAEIIGWLYSSATVLLYCVDNQGKLHTARIDQLELIGD